MALTDSLPELKKKIVQEKQKLKSKGVPKEEIPGHIMKLEREFQEKLLEQEKD